MNKIFILGGNLIVGESGDSWHCRARELFYYLKGGLVDYGPEHSQVYGHTRFGRIYDTGEGFEEHNISMALYMILDLEFFICDF